jgi:hypothetical protein
LYKKFHINANYDQTYQSNKKLSVATLQFFMLLREVPGDPDIGSVLGYQPTDNCLIFRRFHMACGNAT